MDKGIIDLKQINKTEQDLIARQFLPLITKYVEDEKTQADFEKWKQLRKMATV